MEKKTAALKNEIDSSYRIYEDNLRLKVEEIAHLRRELEGAVNDKMACQTQAAESRRAVDAIKDKAETELAALRVQLKGECERQLAGELAEAGLRQAAEKKRLVEDFEGQLNDVRLEVSRKDHETARLREAQRKLEEAVQREADRVAELVSRKNQELDSLRLAKEAQEDAYRKSLEDFRSKLSEAVGKLETYEAGRVLKKPE